MSKQEEFLKQLGWDKKSVGLFDYNELVSLLKTYEENSRDDFESISRKNMRFLSENYNPHTKIISDSTSVEIIESVLSTGFVDEFIK